MLDILIMFVGALILGAVAPWIFTLVAVIIVIMAAYDWIIHELPLVDVSDASVQFESMSIYADASGMIDWTGCIHGPGYTK